MIRRSIQMFSCMIKNHSEGTDNSGSDNQLQFNGRALSPMQATIQPVPLKSTLYGLIACSCKQARTLLPCAPPEA